MTAHTSYLRQEILIIEDDQPTLDLYRRELSREYQVTPCADERELRAILDSRRIAALILEPVPRGSQDLSWLTGIAEACHAYSVPIIVCTTLDKRQRGLDMGVAAYLVKPTLPATLLETLQRIIHQA